jgi:hypothetical protein
VPCTIWRCSSRCRRRYAGTNDGYCMKSIEIKQTSDEPPQHETREANVIATSVKRFGSQFADRLLHLGRIIVYQPDLRS